MCNALVLILKTAPAKQANKQSLIFWNKKGRTCEHAFNIEKYIEKIHRKI